MTTQSPAAESVSLSDARPSDAAIAAAYWEISDASFGTKDDEWIFPALRLVSDRAVQLDALRKRELDAGGGEPLGYMSAFDAKFLKDKMGGQATVLITQRATKNNVAIYAKPTTTPAVEGECRHQWEQDDAHPNWVCCQKCDVSRRKWAEATTTGEPKTPAVEGEEMCPRMASMIEHGMSGINWTPTPTKLVSESERVTMTDVDRFIKATPPGEAVSGPREDANPAATEAYDELVNQAIEHLGDVVHEGAVTHAHFRETNGMDVDYRRCIGVGLFKAANAGLFSITPPSTDAAIEALAKREVVK